ncbi:MAG: MlaE family lipid ABC transporter permease subunit [Deltaproteobacteria bacterium]|nr:MlaE family lipid ABC transporter permease subunit [Deltaproteobacteria bacterium]
MSARLEHQSTADGALLRLSGPLHSDAASTLVKALRPLLRQNAQVTVDLSAVSSIDSSGVAALAEGLLLAIDHGVRFTAIGAEGQVKDALLRAPAPHAEAATEPGPGYFERLGGNTQRAFAAARDLSQLLADTLYWGFVAPLRGRLPPFGKTTEQAVRIGADALGIVTLIAFLLGLIMAFQAAHQLRQFGANIFVANLVGVAIVRELGPLMTAIIVAGRSGSAIAAELGTMVVGEEIDALQTMGIDPIRYLVVPRVFAITFTQPSLTLYANAVGVFGGFLIAIFYLDLSATAYINQTIAALTLGDLLTGLAKSLCFAWVIVITGCFCGLRIKGGAVGVGHATTTAVVASIFAIIVVDSIFTTLATVFG